MFQFFIVLRCKVSASRTQSNLFELLRRRLSSLSNLEFDCKGRGFRKIYQISLLIQKIYLNLQPRKKIFPIKASQKPSNRITF